MKFKQLILRRLVMVILICCLIGSCFPVYANSSNSNEIPPLLITEVVPDSTNYGGADGFEFIEVYNNTDQVLNFADYYIIYRYPTGPQDDAIWMTESSFYGQFII